MRKRNLFKLMLAAALVGATMSFAEGVKANKKSKVYHKPACQHYTAKGSTQSFVSEAAAKQAGYTACKQCGKIKPAPKP